MTDSVDALLPREPWRLVHLGDTSVAGLARWECILHRPLRDGEFMLASKFGQGASAAEALAWAAEAREDRVMRYVSVTLRAPARESLVLFAGESDGEDLF